jgi:hypothetical protein
VQLTEFIDVVLGQLSPPRAQVVDQAFKKFESSRNMASYRTLKDAFDAKKHPEVASGKKTSDEVLNDFLEIFEMHHNTFNGFKKTD